MASPEENIGDSSIMEENVPKGIERMCWVSGQRRRLQTFILSMSLRLHKMGIPGYNVGGGHLQNEFLRLNTMRWI